MKRIYVAGPYSGAGVIDILGNMRRGIALCVELLQDGYAPFCPWLDFQFGLVADISLEAYYAYSMAWLEAADAVFLAPGWEDSSGTRAEMRRAEELGIPVFSTRYDLGRWRVETERVETERPAQ